MERKNKIFQKMHIFLQKPVCDGLLPQYFIEKWDSIICQKFRGWRPLWCRSQTGGSSSFGSARGCCGGLCNDLRREQMLRIDIIISIFRPRRDISEQTRRSPGFIRRTVFPSIRFSQDLVPDTDSVTHLSMVSALPSHHFLISYS